ncbi:type VII secretion integral membrane protein EccD [Mycobacterium sp. M26]|uniref:type VII secretion integral membrane protein EccD n=1 Tax=Mycobacterium sp. M26 TaxID=1762962 RepID=UPI00073F2140|nr:type VII secretion integral membrane protein EccD [Mycobacterium sp. M26]
MTETPVLPIVRIAVLAHGRITDVAVPTELPLRELVPALTRLVPQPDDAGEPDLTPLTLAPIGGAPFSVDASLDTVGIVDGDLLALQPVPQQPTPVGVVEDIADAAVIFSEARRRPWGPARLAVGARLAVATLIVAVSAVAVAHRAGSPIAFALVSAVAVVAAGAALALRARSSRIAGEIAALALLPIAVAFALAVPGTWGPAHLMLAAAAVAAWSVIVLAQSEDRVAVFTAAGTVAAATLLVTAAATLWQLPALTVGCLLIVLALLVTVSAPQLAAVWARFPLPVIPAPGDPIPSAAPDRVLADLPRRIRRGEAHQSGLIAAGVMLSVAGALFVATTPGGPGTWGWYLIAASTAAAVLRARVWDTTACKAWLLSQPFGVCVGLLVIALVEGRLVAATWVLAVLAAVTAIWVLVAVSPDIASAQRYSLPLRRLVGFAASALDASLIPVAVYLIGIFSWVLDR